MRTAPWWLSAGPLTRNVGVLVVMLMATLVGGCIPEHEEEDYALASVTKPSRAEKVRAGAGKAGAIPDRTLMAAVRAPNCSSDAAADAAGSDRHKAGPSARQPINLGGKLMEGVPAGAERQTTASLAAPVTDAASASDQASKDLAARIALEYERACYKQAEIRVRARLTKLQLSVSETIKPPERRQNAER